MMSSLNIQRDLKDETTRPLLWWYGFVCSGLIWMRMFLYQACSYRSMSICLSIHPYLYSHFLSRVFPRLIMIITGVVINWLNWFCNGFAIGIACKVRNENFTWLSYNWFWFANDCLGLEISKLFLQDFDWLIHDFPDISLARNHLHLNCDWLIILFGKNNRIFIGMLIACQLFNSRFLWLTHNIFFNISTR